MRSIFERLNKLARFWLGDARYEARSSFDFMLPTLVAISALCLGVHVAHRATADLVHAPRPRVIPEDAPGGVRFGLPYAKRREIFREFALGEPMQRSQGLSSFPKERWSAEDHRASFERNTARGIMSRNSITLTQVYLVLDEGIRERWPGADGEPLDPTTIALKPRRRY